VSGALSHVRVLDLTDLRGALAGRILADLGADVVKVEPPGGDADRLRPPFAGDVVAADRSLPFLYRNANKHGAVADLRTGRGRKRFEFLCAHADVLVENLGPAAQARHHLTGEELRQRHPHLVHVALSDFGTTGPHAAWRLEPLTAFAASGGLFASGFPDMPPCTAPGWLAHDCASAYAAVAAVAALLDRARHGTGQTIEVSVQDAALVGANPWTVPTADWARYYPMMRVTPPRNADGAYWVLRVADGYVRVLPGSPRQWRAFLQLLGEPDALAGPEWEVPIFRLINGDVIRLIASDALGERPGAQVLAEARRLDVPIAPVNRPEAFVVEEHTRGRRYFRGTGFPHLGDAPMAPGPLNLSRTPGSLRRAAPAPDEDDGAFPQRTHEGARGGGDGPVLAGIRVVDLGVGVAVPEAGRLLAELGAEVIKIESRANLDFLRRVTVEPDQPDLSMMFSDASRGHLSVCLDLRTAPGREVALELCAAADVVLENNRGGVAARWGLGYEDVRARRPDVVYYQSQAFGEGAPLGDVSAYGPLNSAFAGVTWLWNHPDAPYPGGCSLNHPDHVAATLAVVGILAALEHRRRTGQGQRVEMSQAEAAAYLIGEVYLEETCTGRPAQQHGNTVPWACPYDVYPSEGDDRWVAVAVTSDAQWERLVAATGIEAMAAEASLDGRLAARAAIDARLTAWTRVRSAADAAAALQAAGVSAMPVMDGDDLRDDPHLAARGSIVTVEHPVIGPERHAGNPLRPSRLSLVVPPAAPRLGEHTADVMRRWLGLDDAAIARLADDGVSQ
jgi:crotonobetainyl-CoA:carnitine CoA-transferase CaiB-like acyl-CoA transferase